MKRLVKLLGNYPGSLIPASREFAFSRLCLKLDVVQIDFGVLHHVTGFRR